MSELLNPLMENMDNIPKRGRPSKTAAIYVNNILIATDVAARGIDVEKLILWLIKLM